jgi:hypothetical protein
LDADHALLELNKLIPGLGGFYFDSAKVFTIRLKNTADRAFAVKTLRAYLGEWRRAQRLEDVLESGEFKVESAEFEFTELHQWLRATESALWNIDGVSSTDVDEAKGVVAVSVVSDEAQQGVLSLWYSLALPTSALDVRVEPAVRQRLGLQSEFRPTRAGVQIAAADLGACTLGFNAYLAASNRKYFFTNSHCTQNWGGIDNIGIGQPAIFFLGFGTIGSEVNDVAFSTLPGCPPGFLCRRSDSALGRYANNADARVGFIQAPVAACPFPATLCDLTVDTPSSELEIVGSSDANFIVGQTLHKVGRTSGWTFGAVTSSCANVNGPSRRGFLCQTTVDAGATGGDSGSPVFSLLSNSRVVLSGILWGGRSPQDFVFSPFISVLDELGANDMDVLSQGGAGSLVPPATAERASHRQEQ